MIAFLGGCGDNQQQQLPLAWGIGVASFDGFATPQSANANEPSWLASITPTPRLATPTYDGSGQATHPDLLVEPDRVLLALTPYPYSNDRLENPSLLQTLDGATFAPYPGAPSPLVPPPPYDHNDDPDLRRDPSTGAYELLYLETLRPDRQVVVALRSFDLVHWERHDAIVYDFAQGDPFIVSPAAIVDAAGATHMFFVELADRSQIRELVSQDGTTWDAHTARAIALDMGNVVPWHIDVIAGGSAGSYVLLISGYPVDGEFTHQNLYVATSHDELATWQIEPAPLLAFDDPMLDVTTLYRATGTMTGGRLIVFYSMQYQP